MTRYRQRTHEVSLDFVFTAALPAVDSRQGWVVIIKELPSAERRMFSYLAVSVLFVVLLSSFHSLASFGSHFE